MALLHPPLGTCLHTEPLRITPELSALLTVTVSVGINSFRDRRAAPDARASTS